MAIALLIGAQLAGLVMIPLGLPGLWLMLAAGVAHQLLVVPATMGWVAIGIAAGLATIAEILEFTLTARYTKKYGGSKRAGWGALLGGLHCGRRPGETGPSILFILFILSLFGLDGSNERNCRTG